MYFTQNISENMSDVTKKHFVHTNLSFTHLQSLIYFPNWGCMQGWGKNVECIMAQCQKQHLSTDVTYGSATVLPLPP